MVKKQITVLKFFKRDFLTKRFFLWLLSLAILYFLVASIVINIQMIASIFQNPFQLVDKLRISVAIITNTLSNEPILNLVLSILIALLFALNILLVTKKIQFVSKQKNLHLTFGAGVLSIAASGCGACGFSLLSLAGLGGATTLLPFGGIELTLIAFGLLAATAVYNMNSLYKECKVVR